MVYNYKVYYWHQEEQPPETEREKRRRERETKGKEKLSVGGHGDTEMASNIGQELDPRDPSDEEAALENVLIITFLTLYL